MRLACKWIVAGVSRSFLAGVCTMVAVTGAQAAWAQDKPPAPWIKMTTTSGCTFFWYDYDDPTGSWMKESTWTWTGSCSGGVTSGSGVLSSPRQGTMSYSENGQLVQKSYPFTHGLRGSMVGGYFDGRVDTLSDGKMMADYMHETYTMGCGQAASQVYCVPHAAVAEPPRRGAPATTPTAPQLTGSPATAPRVSNDPAIVRSDIMSSSEDRVFAILGELVQTGRIDLAREARNALASRYPNSPLLPLAMQLVDTLMTSQNTQAGVAPAPIAGPAGVAPLTAAPASGGALGIEALRAMVEAQYGSARSLGSAGTAYQVTVSSGGLTIPVMFEITPSAQYVWVLAKARSQNLSPDMASRALRRVAEIQPTMIWESTGGVFFGQALENRGLTQSRVNEIIEKVAADVASSSDLWLEATPAPPAGFGGALGGLVDPRRN